MNTIKKVTITPSDKILNVEKYIFVELDELKKEMRDKGVDLIDLGIGNPDRPTPEPVLKAAIESINNPKNHGYPNFTGKPEFNATVKTWMKNRYNVEMDEDFSVQVLNGGKEGLALISLAYTNPGDVNLVPDPYYPVMSRGTWVAGGEVYHLPLTKENEFLPDLDSVPEEIAKKAKILIINYPNNPTSALAPKWFLEKAVKFCTDNDILLVSDLAYGEICYEGYRPMSIFEIEGAKEVAIEVHTCSKTFNMAGWRIGFVVGKKEFVDTVFTMKTSFDYGTSSILQDAAIEAMKMPYKHVTETMLQYQERRDFLVSAFQQMGWDIEKTRATMYLWLRVPEGKKSREFCKDVMEKTGVVFTPGVAFGKNSDNYFRVSLVQPMDKLKIAIERLKDAKICYE